MSGRIRTIKPELLEDERTASLSDAEFRLFVGMILLADDHGNLRAHPKQIEGSVFWASPGDHGDMADLLGGLSEVGLIRPYKVRSQPYAHISGWSKHQRIDKPAKARLPKPEEADKEENVPENEGSTLPRISQDFIPQPGTSQDFPAPRGRAPDPDPDPDPDREWDRRGGAHTHVREEPQNDIGAHDPAPSDTTPPVSDDGPPSGVVTLPRPRRCLSPAADAILAELEQHPCLAGIATPRHAEHYSRWVVGLRKTHDLVVQAIQDLARKTAAKELSHEFASAPTLSASLDSYISRAHPKPQDPNAGTQPALPGRFGKESHHGPPTREEVLESARRTEAYIQAQPVRVRAVVR